MDFNFLEQPMALKGENIDLRYFTEDEGGLYKATPYLKYVVGRDSQKFFKKMIEKLDDQHQYFTLVEKNPQKEILDVWENNVMKEKYKENFEKLNKKYKEYQDSHPDEFMEVSTLDIGGEDEARFVAGFRPDMVLSLNDAINGYLAASDLVAKYGKDTDNYDSLSRYTYLRVKPEFQEAHKKMKESWYAEFGIPDADNFEKKKVVDNYRFNSARVKKAGVGDDSLVEEFANGLFGYLTSSNAVEFKAKAEAMSQMMDKDIELIFDDSTKFKADKENHKIIIFTVPVGDTGESQRFVGSNETFSPSSSSKIIEITPDDEGKDYSFTFEINTDDEHLRYVKSIVTKADLQKAIKNCLNMTEGIENFRKYYEELSDIYMKL